MQQGGQPEVDRRLSWWAMGFIVAVAAFFGVGLWWLSDLMVQQSVQEANLPQSVPLRSNVIPELTTQVVLSGLDHPWEIAFLPSGQMLYTERKGTLSVVENGKPRVLASVPDIFADGEGGLLGLAVDAKFSENRYIYTCFNSRLGGSPADVRVARWKVNADLSGLSDRTDIITGISSNVHGRHSGCRVAMANDGSLWVGTGDSATPGLSPQRPQDPKSLNGKVLHVDRNGKGLAGNVGGNFDSRIFNYGHRNIQGIALYPVPINGVPGVTVEHGSNIDDEVNVLKAGNFGWDPDKMYTEAGVSMTDKVKFPNAIDAIWSSGNPTQAPSGAAFLRGVQWKAWEGNLAVTVLKDMKLKVLQISSDNKLVKQQDVLVKQFGRLRTAAMGPDGNLYIGTDNGNSKDQIIRITPH